MLKKSKSIDKSGRIMHINPNRLNFIENSSDDEKRIKQNQGLLDNLYDFFNNLLRGDYNNYIYLLIGLQIASLIVKAIK